MAHDITEIDERGSTGKILCESGERFRQLAENLQHVFYLADSAISQVLYISPAYETIWGRTCQSLREEPRSFLEAIHLEDRERMVQALPRKALEEVELVYRIVQPDGTIRWIQDRSVPVRDASGQVYRIAGMAQDITELKQAQEALQKQQKEQQEILDSVPAMIWYKDTENRILRLNKPAAASMNLPVEAVEGRSTYELYPEEAAQYHEDDLEVIRSGKPKLGIVELLQTASGAKRWVKTDKVPYRDDQGKIIGVIVFAVDITDLKRTEEALQKTHDELEVRVEERTAALAAANEELRQSNCRLEAALGELTRAQLKLLEQERLRVLGEMASGIAHDFNNSLSPILGYADLLLTRPNVLDDPARRSECLQLIHAAAADAAGVVRRLKESYRGCEAGELSSAVDLNELIERVITFTQPRWRDQVLASGFTIEIRPQLQEVPPVRGDESELREALTNLIFNAVDAMPRGGTLTLSTRVEGAHVVVEVGDTGAGMTEEVCRRCLEPFFTTKGDHGTGMGLPMAHGIIRRHEGTLEIETVPGRGTRFLIRLPIQAQPVPLAPQASDPVPLKSLCILVVDDEPMIREVMTAFLEADGHRVQTAVHGRDCLAKLHAAAFDLVIIDRAMPEMNGDELALAIKQRAPHLPVVLLTGFGQLMNASGERPNGVDLVLSKPITLNELRDALTAVTAS